MMNNFRNVMDKVKADKTLKENTKEYLCHALALSKQGNVVRMNTGKGKGIFVMKKWAIAACAVLFITLASGGAYAFYQIPVNYISLDINPSVELGVNAFDKVVSAEGINEDGKAVLDGQDIINDDIQDAVNQVMQSVVDKDFVSEDGSTVIAVTAESKNQQKADELRDEGEMGVSAAMSAKKVIAVVYKDSSDLSFRNEAKSYGISPGKLKLIKMLQALDPAITVDQYKDAKVRDIILKANELAKAAGITKLDNNNDDQSKNIDKVLETADKVQQNKLDKSDEQKNDKQNNGNNGKHLGNKKNDKKDNDENINEDQDKDDDEDDNKGQVIGQKDSDGDEDEDDNEEITEDRDDDEHDADKQDAVRNTDGQRQSQSDDHEDNDD